MVKRLLHEKADWMPGLRSPDEGGGHFARGPLFENLVINEMMKKYYSCP